MYTESKVPFGDPRPFPAKARLFRPDAKDGATGKAYMYALFDWDYTLRNGFTVFDFAGYLDRRGILAPGALATMNEYREEYKKGRMSHDDLAEKVPIAFAGGLEGAADEVVEKALDDYLVSFDHGVMHAFTRAVFDYCRRRGIEAVVVSGAPGLVVRRYRDSLGIASINAFDCEVVDGAYTGRVAVNNGFNKVETVRRIVEEHGRRPIFAMGDSSSDAPLLEAARIKLSVGQNWDWVSDRSNHYICDPEEDGSEMIRFLERRIEASME